MKGTSLHISEPNGQSTTSSCVEETWSSVSAAFARLHLNSSLGAGDWQAEQRTTLWKAPVTICKTGDYVQDNTSAASSWGHCVWMVVLSGSHELGPWPQLLNVPLEDRTCIFHKPPTLGHDHVKICLLNKKENGFVWRRLDCPCGQGSGDTQGLVLISSQFT